MFSHEPSANRTASPMPMASSRYRNFPGRESGQDSGRRSIQEEETDLLASARTESVLTSIGTPGNDTRGNGCARRSQACCRQAGASIRVGEIQYLEKLVLLAARISC